MEATGVYWRPVWAVLEDADSVELLLVNPEHFKNLPGRKTDVNDSEWLAQLLECGLLRGSFMPPAKIARLRDLTRYRTKIVQERRAGDPAGAEGVGRRRDQVGLGGLGRDGQGRSADDRSARRG